MSKYFDLFPLVAYDISKDRYRKKDIVTNIFIRLGILPETKSNGFGYYEYLIKEKDTPENLAHKYYGDSEHHWIILYMNDMINPQFDWPMKTDAFSKYISKKYGSIENAANQVHHYTQRIKRTDMNTNVYNEIEMEIDETAYNALPDSSYEVETLSNGQSIEVLKTREAIDCLAWENIQNDKKRNIKLLKKENLAQVLSEFQELIAKHGARKATSRRIIR